MTTITASEVRKLVDTDKLVVGTEQTIENLKKGAAETVVVSSNCPDKVVEDIKHYAELAGTEVLEAALTNEEMGVACKKPFSISVLSIAKGA